MRFTVIQTIYQHALKDKNTYFITGDLGHACEEEFKTNIPKQYLNLGIAEQNIIGTAAGLALSGMKVFVYSIVPFITMRCYEQIKADICYQNLDVTIIGIGGGLIYGQYGNTHCSIEDIAVMRVLPNMKIVSPANPHDAEQLTEQVIKQRGPTYIRIGRGKEPLPEKEYQVTFGKGYKAKEGNDVAIICTGTILDEVDKASRLLEIEKISTEVVHMHTVKPIDTKLVLSLIQSKKVIITVEEHNIIGGLGSAISDIISENPRNSIIFKRLGIKDTYLKEIGSQQYLRKRHGIAAEEIANSIKKMLK